MWGCVVLERDEALPRWCDELHTMAQIERLASFVAIMPGQSDQALLIATNNAVSKRAMVDGPAGSDRHLLWQRTQGCRGVRSAALDPSPAVQVGLSGCSMHVAQRVKRSCPWIADDRRTHATRATLRVSRGGGAGASVCSLCSAGAFSNASGVLGDRDGCPTARLGAVGR